MTLSLKPYPEYKESGLPWLAKIPVHWEVFRNGRLFEQRNQTGFSNLPILEVSLRTGVRVRDFENSNRKQVMSDREKYKRACQGDIAYNMMRMWQGAAGVAPVDGLISPAYVVSRPFPGTESRFFSYLFRTKAYMDEVDKYSHGIVKDRNRLYWEDFKQMPSLVPPIDEQKRIADFLEAYSRIVARLIRAKRRLIELLNEQEQAIIHRAVTRGLDPDVKLKSSGIEWPPDIPEHWKVLKLKRLGRIRYGLGQPPKEAPDGLPLIRATNVKSGRILDKGMIYVDPADVPPTRDAFLHKDEIVVVRSGALTADSAIIPVEYEGAVAGYDMVVTVRHALPQFVAAALLSKHMLFDQLFLLRSRAAQPHLNAEELGNALLVVPPEREQKEIVEYVDAWTSAIRTFISQAEHEIHLLREYHARLIADVVTGKLDLRSVELPALDGAESSEDVDSEDETEADELADSEEPTDD